METYGLFIQGDVKKLVNGKFTTMFTVDSSMDELSVYDDDDIVVWNTKQEIYSTVAGNGKDDE